MKFFVVFACFLAIAAAIDDVTVLRSDAEVKPDGYNYAYELSNGVSASEVGTLTGVDDSIVAQGEFKFTSPEGQTYTVTYTADAEGGFKPTGEHIPAIPVLIQKSLDYLAEHGPTA